MTGEPALDGVLQWTVASVRLLALFSVVPVFAHVAVPARVRVALAMLVAWSLAPQGAAGLEDESLLGWTRLVLAEGMTGLALGFGVRLVFAAFDLLGEFVSVQGGLGAASVIDPASGASSLVLASTLQVFTWLLFLAMDGHHEVLRAAALSYRELPVGGAGPDASAWLALAGLGSTIFETALRLAAPITAAMLVANLAVGILGRTIPQLNLMMLQLPAQVAVSLGMLGVGAATLLARAEGVIAGWPARCFAALTGAH